MKGQDACEDCKAEKTQVWFCMDCGLFLCVDCARRHEKECDGDADSDAPFKHQDGGKKP